MNAKRIAIIGTVGLPAKYGGFETLADHLVTHLCGKYKFTVYCSSKEYPKKERITSYKGADLTYIPLDANGIESILYDSVSILHALWRNDILLILGVSGAWILPFVRLFTNKKIILSIDGIEWKRNKWSLFAKLYLWAVEAIGVRYSHIDISDNDAIQDYTAFRYKTLSRVIEYGGDHTLQVEATREDYDKHPFLHFNYAVKVCRIEPENNVHLVLDAFKNRTELKLVIVGNWNNSEYGKALKEECKNNINIYLLDPIYNQREIDLIRGNATIYIHGHSAGGTNPSLVEAMCLGLPVIAFNVSYNRKTTENKALYFSTSQDLIQHLDSSTGIIRFELGNVMKEIALDRYTWSTISRKYESLIVEVLTTKKKNSVYAESKKIDPQFLLDNKLGHLHNSTLFNNK